MLKEIKKENILRSTNFLIIMNSILKLRRCHRKTYRPGETWTQSHTFAEISTHPESNNVNVTLGKDRLLETDISILQARI